MVLLVLLVLVVLLVLWFSWFLWFSLQNAVVCHFVLPGDVQYATETANVKRIGLLFLSGSQGPDLIAVQEGAEGTGSVDLDFGVLSQKL